LKNMDKVQKVRCLSSLPCGVRVNGALTRGCLLY
jgi:hypothetical protein